MSALANLAPTIKTEPPQVVRMGRRLTVVQAPIERVHPNPANPRGEYFDTTDLELSINAVGQLLPVVAFRDGDGWTLVSGHRRRLAMKRLGRATLDLIEAQSPEDAVVIMAAYNVQQPIPPSKLAQAIQHMVDAHGWTTERAGRALGLSADKAALIRSILDAPPTVQEALDKPPTVKGHLPLAAYKEMPRRAPKAVQERILADAAQDGKVTVDRIRKAKAAAQERGEAARQRVAVESDDATDAIERLNALRGQLASMLAEVATLSEIDQARAEFLLSDIKTMIEGVL